MVLKICPLIIPLEGLEGIVNIFCDSKSSRDFLSVILESKTERVFMFSGLDLPAKHSDSKRFAFFASSSCVFGLYICGSAVTPPYNSPSNK